MCVGDVCVYLCGGFGIFGMNLFYEDVLMFVSVSLIVSVGVSDNRVDVYVFVYDFVWDVNVEDGWVWGLRGERDDGGRFDGGAEGGALLYDDCV